ncbi:MAG: ferritin-like domain-containing protein [Steroidobacteraceae bacterium]
MNQRYTIVTLSELLRVARDGERGFSTCADRARSATLQSAFKSHAGRYAATVAELRELVGQLGGDPGMRGTILGGARRGWVNLRAALALNEDEALVDACEHGEDHALEVYRNALDDHLPEFVRHVVLRQFESMMNDHHQLRIILRNEPPPGGRVVASHGGHARQ